MKLIGAMTSGTLLALIQSQVHATGDANSFRASMSDTQEYLQLEILTIAKIDATNVVGRPSDRINGIAARTKVMSVTTNATVYRKKSVIV